MGEVRALPGTTAPPGIGKRLQDARQSHHLSIEEAAWRTRIRPGLLRALEREQFDPLRSVVFVRGALQSYARYLGLDSGEIAREYSQRYELSEPSSLERLDKEIRIARKAPRPKWLLAAVASAVVLVVAAIVGVLGAGPKPASSRPVAAVTVRVDALRATDVTITADGRTAYTGRLAIGDSRTLTAARELRIEAADGSALHLFVNGRDAGAASTRPGAYRARFGPRGRVPT